MTLQAGITLAAARKAAADALFEVQQGRDPAAAKQQARQAQRLAAGDTFENIAAEYLKREGDRLRSANWQRSVLRRHVLPTLGPRPVGDIRRSEIIRLLDAIEEGSGPVMSDRTLAIIRRVMNWHAIRSDTFASPIVRGMARAGTRDRARVLTDGELRAVWTTAEASATPFGYLLRFALLTACRRGEATHLRWSELADGVWTLPASRNKTGVELVRPLSAAALDILAKVPRVVGGEFVFSAYGRRPLGGLSQTQESVRRGERHPGVDHTRSAKNGAQSHEPCRRQCRHWRARPRPRLARCPRHLRPPPLRPRDAQRLRGAGGADRAHRRPGAQRRRAAGARLTCTAPEATTTALS